MDNKVSDKDRINSLLADLKSDLIGLRHQDVSLMRQMIYIDDTSRLLANRMTRDKSSRVPSADGPESAAPLLRRQSAPALDYLVRNESASSLCTIEEDVTDEDEDVEEEESYEETGTSSIFTISSPVPRHHSCGYVPSFHYTPPNECDNTYHDILLTNIRFWKEGRTVIIWQGVNRETKLNRSRFSD